MRLGIYCLLLFLLTYCTPKGPQTYTSSYVGKTKEQLIASKGPAHRIKVFDSSEAYIYVKKEEYYGKNVEPPFLGSPKRTYEIEFIYYINAEGVIYKYQIWRKRIK